MWRRILSKANTILNPTNIKASLILAASFFVIVMLSSLSLLGIRQGERPGIYPPSGSTPYPVQTSMFGLWPLWGTLVPPTLGMVLVAISLFGLSALAFYWLYSKGTTTRSFIFLTLLGLALIVLSNGIDGWANGIEMAISGTSEIFHDAVNILNPIDFISNYDILQPTLTVHAQTQPPGAVLSIYLLYILFGNPGIIAIAVSTISGLVSAYFIRGLFRKWFDDDSANYTAFLFLLLPAVQIYFLANVYAIVAMLAFASIYYYLHDNQKLSYLMTTVIIFLGTFVSFLFVWVLLFLFIYEILSWYFETSGHSLAENSKLFVKHIMKIVVIGAMVGVIYGLLFVTLNFNYISAFLYANSLENPTGFMLFADPIQYLSTRIQDVLDILFFFGPVLSVLCYQGLKQLRSLASSDEDACQMFIIVISALLALGLMFLSGAPKKGETARICMFILPFLLIPVASYLFKNGASRRELFIVLVLVFGQAILMQLFGSWVW